MKKIVLLLMSLAFIISAFCMDIFADDHTYEPLNTGYYGTAVKEMQKKLAELGFLDPGGVDGSYGKGTAKAVSAFQASVGMEETGIADEATLRALYAPSDDSNVDVNDETENISVLEKYGLIERVHDLSDVSGLQKYDLPSTVSGGNYVFTVTPFWGKLDFPDDHEAGCFVPAKSKWQALPYQEHFKPAIDLVEEKAKAEDEHEWRCIAVDIATNGAPGYSYSNALTDYYDAERWDKSFDLIDLNGKGAAEIHRVVWNGKEQNVYGMSTFKTNGATKVVTLIQMYYVPVGYDGIVFLLDGSGVNFLSPQEYAQGDNLFNYVTDHTLLFRVK